MLACPAQWLGNYGETKDRTTDADGGQLQCRRVSQRRFQVFCDLQSN